MRRVPGVLAAAIAAVSCLMRAVPGSATATPEWTVMLYFGGDAPTGGSSLEAAVMDRVRSLLDPGPTANVNVVALVDRASGVDSDNTTVPLETSDGYVEANWVGTKVLHLLPQRAVEIGTGGALDLGDPATLEHFVRVAVTEFPARRYALAVKGHARADISIGIDSSLADGTEDALTIDELVRALERLRRSDEVALDLLVLDGCGSATVDTVGALAPYADAIVASADLLFARSVPYRHLVAALGDGPSLDGLAAADVCVRAYPEGSARRSNLPLVCPPSAPYGTLGWVSGKQAAQLRGAFDALGREALRVLRGGDARAVHRLAVARTRAFKFSNGTEMHFDAASVADELTQATSDDELRGAGRAAALAARSAAAGLRNGADLLGTCGFALCWPCQDGSTEYVGSTLWSDRGWPTFAREFELAFPDCSLDVPPNDMITTAEADPRAIVRSRHTGGPVGAAPYVGKRTFVVDGVGDRDDATFMVPFAFPPLVPGELTASAEFQNAWAYGRIVFTGEAVGDNAPAWIECPIESVQVRPDTDFNREVTCSATTSPLRVTLPNGWCGDVQMRMTLTQGARIHVLWPPPGLDLGRRPRIGPRPWLDRWRLPWDPWTPRVVCAFARPAPSDCEADPAPMSDPPKPDGSAPDGGPSPAPSPDGVKRRYETPIMVVFPDGTRIQTIRRVAQGGAQKREYGNPIILRTHRGCVRWQRFDSGDEVRVGHVERLADRRERSSFTLITVP